MIKRRKPINKIILFIMIAILLSVSSFLIFQNGSFKYCSNEINLLKINDSIKELKLNLNQTKDKLSKEIEEQYDYNISDKLLECKIELSKGEFIGFNFKKSVHAPICSVFYTSIFINRNNQLLFEEELLESKDLKTKIYNLLLEQNYYDKFNLSLEWERISSLETIENVLIQIQKAYQMYYRTKAKEKFNKNICELNETELLEINKVTYSLYLVNIIPQPSLPAKKSK